MGQTQSTTVALAPEAIAADVGFIGAGSNDYPSSAVLGSEPHELVWRQDVNRRLAAIGLAKGPWWDAAAAVKGWKWVRRAVEELKEGSTMGYVGEARSFTCGEYNVAEEGNGLHGYGISVQQSLGAWSVGEYRDGLLHGKGERHHINGSFYIGEWVNDKESGRGTRVYPDGDFYEGEFLNGEPHGQGVMIRHRGRCCDIGVWEEGRIKGKMRHSQCACFDSAPNLVEQLEHLRSDGKLCKPFGFSSTREKYDDGLLHGLNRMVWCNGDVLERTYEHGKEVAGRCASS